MLKRAAELLQSYFGFDRFRTGQEDIIESVLEGNDTLGIMPTGGGKSVCYQIPAMIFPGITLVISPLISLMKDQVDAAVKAGLPATYLNSTLSGADMQETLSGIYNGHYKLVYIAPERLDSGVFTNILRHISISMIAIDEAHCISHWGHDFRPSYLSIQRMIPELNPKPTVLALTATATPQVQEDIRQQLRIDSRHTIVTGFARDNLRFEVIKGQNRDLFIWDYLKENPDQSGIIYTATRKEAERLRHQLSEKGLPVAIYHGGLPEEERNRNQERFLYDDLPIMIATNAFGMGINKSNVRFVIHFNVPRNMESYYQEAGRAGRDGENSDCILLFAPQDTHIQSFLIDQSGMDEQRKENEYGKLRKMTAYGHTESCLQQYILEYFGEEGSSPCGRCANCTDVRESVDVTVEAQKVLSCVKRMGERFGKTMIAKVLTGSADQKIKSFRFDTLSTYGIMKDSSQKEVAEFIDFLTAEGYLRPTDGTYPTLVLTEIAAEVLRGQLPVWKKEKAKITRLAEDNLLFEKLRTLRKEIAEEEKVPPYIIFSDTALKEMSALLPQSESEFFRVKGVGKSKLEAYGEVFLREIRAYCEENDIQRKSAEESFAAASPRTGRSQNSSKEPSHHVTYRLLQEGCSISDIASQRGLSERTVEGHIRKCPEDGLEVDWSAFIPDEYERMIGEAVEQADSSRLTPIKDLLPEEVTYFMIHAFLARKNERDTAAAGMPE